MHISNTGSIVALFIVCSIAPLSHDEMYEDRGSSKGLLSSTDCLGPAKTIVDSRFTDCLSIDEFARVVHRLSVHRRFASGIFSPAKSIGCTAKWQSFYALESVLDRVTAQAADQPLLAARDRCTITMAVAAPPCMHMAIVGRN